MIRCPVCSSEVESTAQLVRCEGCIWEDREAALEAQDRLAALRKGAGEHAYGRDGCQVCPRCRAYFQPRSAICPLVLLYNAPADPPDDPENEPERFLEPAEEYWDTYLHAQGYPEHVEAYWRRLSQRISVRFIEG